MPKYRIIGKDNHMRLRKEIVDAHDLDTSLSIAYARGISKTADVEIEELSPDGSTQSKTRVDAGLYEDAIDISNASRLQRAPISTIAMGVFAGLFLFFVFLVCLSCLTGNAKFYINI